MSESSTLELKSYVSLVNGYNAAFWYWVDTLACFDDEHERQRLWFSFIAFTLSCIDKYLAVN